MRSKFSEITVQILDSVDPVNEALTEVPLGAER